ncbi:F120B protein, partial [Edolisoma coerulescens]|nr:F120B protein [Edolisoma coerulescens]
LLSDCCEFRRSTMGVRGLQGFVARVCPDACKTVDLREMAEKHRTDHPDSPPLIVVDAMSCVRRWYTPESWVCGGQWREYLAILEDFINAFKAAGIKLVFYFDGVVEEKKREEWIKRRMKNTEEIATLFRFIKTHRKQPGREMFVLPSALPTFTRFALKSLGQKTVCTLQEADFEVAAYGLQHNCIGILGQDSDYLIYDTCPYFSIENLHLDRLVTVMYSREVLCRVLGISLTHLPLFACLLGNDVVPESLLEGFWHKCLTTSPHRNNSYNRRTNILLSVANYISKIPCSYSSLKHLGEMLPLGSDKSLLYRGVNSYLLPGQQSPWIPPNVINCQMSSLQQQSALCQDKEIFQVTFRTIACINMSIDAAHLIKSGFSLNCQVGQIMGSSSCIGQQLGTEIYFPSFSSPVIQPQLSQPVFIAEVLQPSDHLCSPPLDSLQQVKVLPMLGTSELDTALQVGSHQSRVDRENPLPLPAGHAALDAAQGAVGFLGCERTLLAQVKLLIQQHPKALLRAALNPFSTQPVFVLRIALTQVRDLVLGPVEIDEVCTGPPLKPVPIPLDGSLPSCMMMAQHSLLAKEQHIQSENYSIFNILSNGEIECSNSLEDDYDTEIPGQALIYRPARQHIYSILLESGKDGAYPLVKEWFVYFGNPLKQPELIQPVQPSVTGGTPNLKTLWLAKGPDVEKQRYSTFLACFHLQDEMGELQALEAPVAGFCCLLAYLMMQVSSLSLEDLNAFLALILCLKGKSAAQLTGLQLAQVDSRGVHLGAVLIRGLTTLLMANSACGFPFRMDDLMPWAVFDGKLFQEKYQQSHRGCSVEELLEGNVS